MYVRIIAISFDPRRVTHLGFLTFTSVSSINAGR